MGYLLAALLGGTLFFNSQATPETRGTRRWKKALRRQYPSAQIDVQAEGKRGFERAERQVQNGASANARRTEWKQRNCAADCRCR